MHNELTSFLFKKFKSCLSLLLIVLLAFSLVLVGCSDDDGDKDIPEDFAVDLSTLPKVKNTTPFTITWDDLLIEFPSYPDIDFTKYSRLTVKVKYFDLKNNEIPQSHSKAMVSLIYDPAGDIRGPNDGPGPNTPLKEFHIGGVRGRVHRDSGAPLSLTKAPGAILLQSMGSPDVKYIEVTEIKFHNSTASLYEPPPASEWPAEKWSSSSIDEWPLNARWIGDGGISTVNAGLSLDTDTEVVTVIVSGTPESGDERYKKNVFYVYSPEAGKRYIYKFQAWTEEGTRPLYVMYYNGWDIGEEPYTYLISYYDIDATPNKEYEIKGDPIPTGGFLRIEFQCADKLGKFYLKMISIEEYTE